MVEVEVDVEIYVKRAFSPILGSHLAVIFFEKNGLNLGRSPTFVRKGSKSKFFSTNVEVEDEVEVVP